MPARIVWQIFNLPRFPVLSEKSTLKVVVDDNMLLYSKLKERYYLTVT